MPWTVRRFDSVCGFCAVRIPAGMEVWHMRLLPHVVRCSLCAPDPVDATALEAARAGVAPSQRDLPTWTQLSTGMRLPPKR